MVTELAMEAGLPRGQLCFDIQRVGNTSAASIPLAIHDAVVEGVIDKPMRLFAPGFLRQSGWIRYTPRRSRAGVCR